MKRVKGLLVVLLCLFLAGCNNEFAEQEYNSIEKIAQTEDRYAKEMSVFNTIEGGYLLTVSKFDGRQTLWTKSLKEAQELEIEFHFSLAAGQAKVVHIDEEGNVATVLEYLPESGMEDGVTKTVSLQKGKNRLKIVGYDCEDLELQMLFEEP